MMNRSNGVAAVLVAGSMVSWLVACGPGGAGGVTRAGAAATGASSEAGANTTAGSETGGGEMAASVASDAGYVLGHEVRSIDGSPVLLEQYKGKVVVIVNVASECGYTPQYKNLQALYEARKDAGVVVLGFPANNFGGQEPGSNEEIATFCESKFGVTFPMFEKVSVKGDDAHPLFRQLSERAGEAKWNFTKWIVGKDGRVVEKLDSGVKPDSPEVMAKIDALLAG